MCVLYYNKGVDEMAASFVVASGWERGNFREPRVPTQLLIFVLTVHYFVLYLPYFG